MSPVMSNVIIEVKLSKEFKDALREIKCLVAEGKAVARVIRAAKKTKKRAT